MSSVCTFKKPGVKEENNRALSLLLKRKTKSTMMRTDPTFGEL